MTEAGLVSGTEPGRDGQSARERIQAAYSPDSLRRLGTRLVELLAGHLRTVEQSGAKVLNWNDPLANIERAGAVLDAAPAGALREPAALAERFEAVVREMLDRGQNLHDPRYVGHQVPASIPLAGLFDAVGSVTNQVMAIYEMGPWATAVERSLIARLGRAIGWPDNSFAGLVTHGGSLGNLTALLTARNVALGQAWEAGLHGSGSAPVLVAHRDAHYSVARAAGVLGLGTRNIVRAELDDRRRIDPDRLDRTLADLRRRNVPVIAVSACACATPIGAFDRLNDLAEVCRRREVWLHVDAAHGGAACLSRRYRQLVAGLDRSDSLVWDAHKMLFVPALCAFVFYRDRNHRFEAFRQDAPYLFDPSAPGLADFDSGMLTPECTKRAAAFGLWGVWSLFGPGLFEDLVDATFDLGRTFYERLDAAPDFEPLHEPECNIVAFRYVPAELRDADEERLGRFLLDLRRELIQSGEYYLVQAKLDGRQALRVTLINPLTTIDHLDGLLDAIRRSGRRILDGEPSSNFPPDEPCAGQEP